MSVVITAKGFYVEANAHFRFWPKSGQLFATEFQCPLLEQELNRSTQHLPVLARGGGVRWRGTTPNMVSHRSRGAELWERWKNGQCVADIARALERRNKSGVYRILWLSMGGIAPEPRRRASRKPLRLEERREISRGITADRSIRRIALGLRRSPSTVSREIEGVMKFGCSAYRAGEADRRAWQRALRPKRFPSPGSPHAKATMAGSRRSSRTAVVAGADRQLAEAATPYRPRHADITHETIYRSLFIQTRGVLKKQLMAHLRTARQMRQAKGGNTKSGLGQIVGTVAYLHPRTAPAEANRTAPCQVTGKEIFSPGRTTRTSADARRAPYPLC